jgi:hypothetical protein
VSNDGRQSEGRLIFTAPAGLHSHFPLWAQDARFIYFVQGSLPDKLDIWRVRAAGSTAGIPERITSHNTRVTYPVLTDQRTLLYLASDPDGWDRGFTAWMWSAAFRTGLLQELTGTHRSRQALTVAGWR